MCSKKQFQLNSYVFLRELKIDAKKKKKEKKILKKFESAL